MSQAHDHMQSQIAELGARAQQLEQHAAVLLRMARRADKSSDEFRALVAAEAVLNIRAAEARFDAKQMAQVEAELTRAGQ